MIKKRLDASSNPFCDAHAGCPAVFELDDGNFAFIGEEITNKTLPYLPPGSGCAASEKIVRLPREVILSAIETLR